MTRVTFVLWLRLPLVPVITSGYVPGWAGLFTLMVSLEFPEPVTVVGLNDELVRAGTPLALSATVPEKPFTAAIETVKLPCDLRATLRVDGTAESVKSAAALTVNVTEAVWTKFPLVAVIVS